MNHMSELLFVNACVSGFWGVAWPKSTMGELAWKCFFLGHTGFNIFMGLKVGGYIR